MFVDRFVDMEQFLASPVSLAVRGRTWCKRTPRTSAAVPLPPAQEPFVDVILFSFSFSLDLWVLRSHHVLASPQCLPVGRNHSWNTKKEAAREKGQLQTISGALSCHISTYHISGQCQPIIGCYLQGMMSVLGGWLDVTCYLPLLVCHLLIIIFLPFLFIIIFPQLILLTPEGFFFSVFPLGRGCGFQRKTFWPIMHLSIRKRSKRSTSC